MRNWKIPEFLKTPIYLDPHDNYISLLPSRDCVAIRHPGQVLQSWTRAGIQKEFDYIELPLDSGSRPPSADSSGMTGSANCDIVSRGRGDSCGAKFIGIFNIRISDLLKPDFGLRILKSKIRFKRFQRLQRFQRLTLCALRLNRYCRRFLQN